MLFKKFPEEVDAAISASPCGCQSLVDLKGRPAVPAEQPEQGIASLSIPVYCFETYQSLELAFTNQQPRIAASEPLSAELHETFALSTQPTDSRYLCKAQK